MEDTSGDHSFSQKNTNVKARSGFSAHCSVKSFFISKEEGCTAPLGNCPVLNYPHSGKFLSLYPFRILLDTTFNHCLSTFHSASPRTVWLHLPHNPALGNWKQQFDTPTTILSLHFFHLNKPSSLTFTS